MPDYSIIINNKILYVMAIKYIRVKRNVRVGYNPGEKYMATIKRDSTIDLKRIYEDMTDLSSLSRGDIKSSVDNLLLVMIKYLCNGSTVNLGEFGIFTPFLSAEACDTLEEVTADTIRKVNIRFRPSKELILKLEQTSKELGSLEAKGYQPLHPTPNPQP